MAIRQANQQMKIRQTQTSVRSAGTSLRTAGGITVLSGVEHMEAEDLIRKSLSSRQKRIWEQMSPRKKEKYIFEVAEALRTESTQSEAMQMKMNTLTDKVQGISTASVSSMPDKRRIQVTYERILKRQEQEPEIQISDEQSDEVKARVSNQSIGTAASGKNDLKRASRYQSAKPGAIIGISTADRKATDQKAAGRKKPGIKNQKLPALAVSAALMASLDKVRRDMRIEEQNESRKQSMAAGLFSRGLQDALPVIFAGRKGATGGTLLSGLKKTASVIGTVFKPFLIMTGTLLLTVILILVILFPGSLQDNTATMEGLPAMISEEMVTAAIEMRDEYDQPASVLLAQIIVESRGRYGNGLSLLAYQYNNLFGIKSFSSGDNRIFMWNRAHTDGGWYRVFESHTECIEYRAQMLQKPRYAQYLSGIDWRTKEGAQAYAQGIKNGGWAEADNYVSALVDQMNQYDLYRYDSMSEMDALSAGTLDGGSGTEVVEYACQFIGNRYVWGGTSLTDGCDCSGFVMRVYEHFGISMPHSSYAQQSVGRAVSVEDMQPGDIVCYSGHVGIYAGNGQIINASNSKPYPAGGIKYTNVGYRTIVAVRRIF